MNHQMDLFASGSKVVSLREKNLKHQCRVHRIVWIAANGVPPEGMTIDHINNDKLNNGISNLQLMTYEDNSSKAHADGLVPHKKKLTDDQANEMLTIYSETDIPVELLASKFGICKHTFYQYIHRVGWTKIPYRGKPAEECPDGPRYKACGNSMAVNVMEWIGLRIQMVEDREKRQAEKEVE